MMKTLHGLLFLLLALAASTLQASDSKRTADYILSTPADFEGKSVPLDVAFVKPVHWKSPVPELAFFHAMTLDRREYKPGGEILVVIPAADASSFSKKYGTDFKGRSTSLPLQGILVAVPGGKMPAKVWTIDTTGKVADLVKDHKLAIEEESGPGQGGPGPGPGRGPGPGMRRPGLN